MREVFLGTFVYTFPETYVLFARLVADTRRGRPLACLSDSVQCVISCRGRRMLRVLVLCLLLPSPGWSTTSYRPEQVHIAYGDAGANSVVVTWSTLNDTNGSSLVEYGVGGFSLASPARSTLLRSVSGHRTQYVHRATLSALHWNTKYVYHCGSAFAWSDVFWFETPPDPASGSWSPSLAVYGDMGSENSVSLPRLQQEAQTGLYDAILHVGDFAYDMNTEHGETGDEFMRLVEPLAAYVPYMTCPGNHEEAGNFSDYRGRFSMPGNTESLMYSFNMGPVHFVSISTEFYYFLEYGLKLVVAQYDWLQRDLEEANRPENRSARPWIIVFGHRPMYCSNANTDDCTFYETRVRVGLPFTQWFGLEELFYKQGVDLEIWAHEHSYERMWPLYNYTVLNGTDVQGEPYRNPRAPVHITTGSAGCKELHDHFKPKAPSWSAFRTDDYGFMRMRIFNSTHLYTEQVSMDQGGKVVDHMWLIKDRHGAYDEA